MAKSAAKASTQNTRGIQCIVDKIDLHTKTFVRLEEKINLIRRAVTKYDRPVNMGQLRANPDLNPWLQGYIPFGEQCMVVEFFDSRERSYELTRWVLAVFKWDYNNFISRVVDALCTPEYRIDYSYPGKST